jgi:two-component system, LytTR family, response regulator
MTESTIRVIIYDDFQPALAELRAALEKFPHVEIVGEAMLHADLERLMKTQKPDLLLLDIDSPEGSIFKMLGKMENDLNCEVVFVTAFKEYVIRAFNLGALHYILKPITADQIKWLVDVFNQNSHKRGRAYWQIIVEFLNNNPFKRLMIPSLKKIDIINIEDIMYCKAEGVSTQYHTTDGKKFLYSGQNLKQTEELLTTYGLFKRPHNSYLAQFKYIKEIRQKEDIILENNERLPISRAHKEDFMNWLSECSVD